MLIKKYRCTHHMVGKPHRRDTFSVITYIIRDGMNGCTIMIENMNTLRAFAFPSEVHS
jgi:hypothetical protein